MCLRCHNESRSAWTQTALAVRIGHALGLHRDGAGSSFPPLETELRRRLWWQINALDIRDSEDRGSDPMILEQSFNTEMPSNVNDQDLDPRFGTRPRESVGTTEMTFCLMCHEVTNVMRRLIDVPPRSRDGKGSYILSRQEKENMVRECSERLESKYLIHCETSIPIFWLASIVGRIITLKLWLFLQYPHQPGQPTSRSDATKESNLRTAVSILELAHLLDTSDRAANWKWLGKLYLQWHPLAVTLAELCVQTRGHLVDRAWAIVNIVFEQWSERVADTKKGALWRPMKKLYSKAQTARLQYATELVDQAMLSPGIHTPNTIFEIAHTEPEYLSSFNPLDMSLTDALKAPDRGALQSLGTQQQAEFNGYTPAEADVNMSQELEAEPVDWADWDEFIRSTWDAEGPAHGNASAQWSGQFVF